MKRNRRSVDDNGSHHGNCDLDTSLGIYPRLMAINRPSHRDKIFTRNHGDQERC